MADRVNDELLHDILKTLGIMRGEFYERFGLICGKLDGIENQLAAGKETMLDHDRRIANLEMQLSRHLAQVRMFFLIGGALAAVIGWGIQSFWPIFIQK